MYSTSPTVFDKYKTFYRETKAKFLRVSPAFRICSENQIQPAFVTLCLAEPVQEIGQHRTQSWKETLTWRTG